VQEIYTGDLSKLSKNSAGFINFISLPAAASTHLPKWKSGQYSWGHIGFTRRNTESAYQQ